MDPTKVKSYLHMVMVNPPFIIVGCALDSVILKITYLDITLFSQTIPACDLISETSSLLLLYCPQNGPQLHTMLSEISSTIFPGTSYNTAIALMQHFIWVFTVFTVCQSTHSCPQRVKGLMVLGITVLQIILTTISTGTGPNET